MQTKTNELKKADNSRQYQKPVLEAFKPVQETAGKTGGNENMGGGNMNGPLLS